MTDGFKLPKWLWHTARTLPTSQAALHVSADVLAAAAAPAEAVLARLGTTRAGLPIGEAAARLASYGPNLVTGQRRRSRWRILGRGLVNPLVVLLAVLAVSSLLTGDLAAALLISAMLVIGGRPSARPHGV